MFNYRLTNHRLRTLVFLFRRYDEFPDPIKRKSILEPHDATSNDQDSISTSKFNHSWMTMSSNMSPKIDILYLCYKLTHN